MYKSLKERGRAASNYYAGRKEYFYLTPASLTLLQGLLPLVEEHCRGRVLDAGVGRGVYRELLQNQADDYIGVDITHTKATDLVGDVQRLPFADASFDTVFCSQVLEHVPEPGLALTEFRRVLKDDGTLILTVPHISWLHNEPHDYYRYTSHGLRFLLSQVGFLENELRPVGGLVCLAGHILSTVGINLTFGIPAVHPAVCFVNSLLVKLCSKVDMVFDTRKSFPLNYLCVFKVK